MLICPIQDSARFDLNWIRVRPRITQGFGERPEVYKQFGLAGHNGRDYGVPVGTPVFAPMSGYVKIKNSGEGGYGLHVKIRNPFRGLECVLGHLSSLNVVDGQIVNTCDKVGLSGNTGFSSGPHLHEGFRRIRETEGNIFKWPVLDYNNGYFGYFDHEEFTINWKGTFLTNTL